MKHFPFPLVVATLLTLLLSGCGRSDADLREYIASVKSRKSQDINPIPQVKPYEPFEYIAGVRRDPFVLAEPQAEQSVAAANGPRPDLRRNREALEEYPLDALKMVGTINTKSGSFALIKAPDGVVHRVTLRNHIGQNYGEIIRITESEIGLLELVPDGFGGWAQRPASVALSQ